jgi:uncharacterized protein (TIGR02996 family)
VSDRDAFLAAIHDAPEDDAPRLVFADWLDENGEPERAEFIRIQVEMWRERERHEHVTPKLDELFLRQKELFICPWADAAKQCGAGAISTYSRGFPDVLFAPAAVFVEQANNVAVWIGPKTRVHLRECHGMLAAVAREPGLAYVRNLTLGTGWREEEFTDEDVVALFKSKFLTNLREFRFERSTHSRPLSSKVAIAIAGALWLPGLRTLDLTSIPIGNAGVRALAKASHLKSLHGLDLSQTGLSISGVRALCSSRHLTGIEWLNVGGNNLPAEEIAPLVERFGQGVIHFSTSTIERK